MRHHTMEHSLVCEICRYIGYNITLLTIWCRWRYVKKIRIRIENVTDYNEYYIHAKCKI